MYIKDGRVISNFIIQALKGKPITIYGDGTQTRSFCYVDDTVQGLIKLMDTSDEVTGPINLGNPHEMTILELAQQVCAAAGSSPLFQFEALPIDDPRRDAPTSPKLG